MAVPALNVEILEHTEPIEQPRRLRTLGRIIPWPHQPRTRTDDDAAGGGTKARAEIRTKRFIEHRRVEEDHYDAEIFSADSSLRGVMLALTEALKEMDEFTIPRSTDEPLTMEIRLRF